MIDDSVLLLLQVSNLLTSARHGVTRYPIVLLQVLERIRGIVKLAPFFLIEVTQALDLSMHLSLNSFSLALQGEHLLPMLIFQHHDLLSFLSAQSVHLDTMLVFNLLYHGRFVSLVALN